MKRTKKRSDPLFASKGIEIREGQVHEESDTDSDESNTDMPYQTVDPDASTIKEGERLSKMEKEIAGLKSLLTKLLP